MNKTVQRKKRKKHHHFLRLLLILLCLALAYAAYLTYIFQFYGKKEPPALTTKTDLGSAVYTLEQFCTEMKAYQGLYEEAIEKHKDEPENGTYPIPGLNGTITLERNMARTPSICTSMTPQGIAVSDDYLFISAYCHTKSHNSVIYVLDKRAHTFVKEIVLPNKSHVGSLAYDRTNDNLWVCGNWNGVAQVNALAMEEIEDYHFTDEYTPISFLHVNNLFDLPHSSFMTCHGSYLYVGYHSTSENGMIKRYEVLDNGNITNETIQYDGKRAKRGIADSADIEISSYAQGMTFLGDLLFLSYSIGIMPSRLTAHQISENAHSYTNEIALQNIQLPSMLEQICVDGGSMYLLFESAAYAYRPLPGMSVDRVIKIDLLPDIRHW